MKVVSELISIQDVLQFGRKFIMYGDSLHVIYINSNKILSTPYKRAQYFNILVAVKYLDWEAQSPHHSRDLAQRFYFWFRRQITFSFVVILHRESLNKLLWVNNFEFDI